MAPSPHHDEAMMDQFVSDLVEIWTEVGLELKPAAQEEGCPEGKEACAFCQRPLLFDRLEAREPCRVPNCPVAA